LTEVERRKIEHALKETGGNRVRAADLLQIPQRALAVKLREYQFE
jgi:DNA-binding NtrC family response regulator